MQVHAIGWRTQGAAPGFLSPSRLYRLLGKRNARTRRLCGVAGHRRIPFGRPMCPDQDSGDTRSIRQAGTTGCWTSTLPDPQTQPPPRMAMATKTLWKAQRQNADFPIYPAGGIASLDAHRFACTVRWTRIEESGARETQSPPFFALLESGPQGEGTTCRLVGCCCSSAGSAQICSPIENWMQDEKKHLTPIYLGT